MKLNPDCMRDILIFAESIPYGRQSGIDLMCEQLTYTYEELDYTTIKLQEAGLLDVISSHKLNHVGLCTDRINGLTFNGHQILANIRNEKIWEPTKSIAKEIGATSVQALTQIASGVVTQIITKHLGY
ncbi:DUF2513 domain-containing protein [Peptostreptococcus equinus]|uniref:DUF2513 domain-containing protein n=1 Tax=Peptostreptococcus equinus TaxID=3003601 RepID=A0ABY7JRF8_9FIRM|nr:DUF2513 domain-containing protein [Peptostreptococcus sp. CBA3647]WAW15426.1 DUF2513 domain-containing protein [Peptostreptococcus sp. CBA3647]